MDKEQAETIALQALSFLAKDETLLDHFLTLSGLTLQELKRRLREPDLLGGVLDAILADDTVLLSFCNATSLSPDTLVKARRALPGGYEVYGS
ncbi:MAG: DUF3572 domain-containing protein [Alphaproteobacteria bacterium]|jgi:hypothetical protein|nr:DUF3572 domain-containing protein [Alphaproteobacteria bacterium]